MKALIVIHWSGADIGSILRLAAERGIDVEICNPSAGEALPIAEEFDTIICMGGPQSAVGAVEEYLHAEMQCLRSAVAEGKPVLGICLGSQLLARALGGTTDIGSTGVEAGHIDLIPATGVAGFPEVSGRFFSFHSDTFEIPPEATLIASSDRYPQAWSYGSALALQFHPELSSEGISQLLAIEGEKIAEAGVDVDAIRVEAESPLAQRAGEVLLGEWLDRSLAAHSCHQETASNARGSIYVESSSNPQLPSRSGATRPLSI